MKRFFCTAALSIVLLALAGCGSGATPAADSSSTIIGILWKWQSVTNQDTNETTTVPNPENYTIEFDEDGTFTGQADCNTIAGTYSANGDFTITLGPTTLAFCGEASLDTLYLDLLSNVVAGGPDGVGGLALETPGGEQRMRFSS